MIWSARAATQLMIAVVTARHRTKRLADELTRRIAAELDDTEVVWPGSFDGLVNDAGTLVTERRTNGTFSELVRLLQRVPAIVGR